MAPSSRLAFLLAIGALATLSGARAAASIGLSEWEIYTPGGHLIAHSDNWKAEHGDCLLREGAAQPLVSHLLRWRYYPGFVMGQTASEFFLLDEKTDAVSRFVDERGLEAALRKRTTRPALSDWLDSRDGWTEAWFPLLVWPRCQQTSAIDPDTKATCDRYLSPKGLALARATTWGRTCAAASAPGAAGAPGPYARQIEAWCKLIGPRPLKPGASPR